MMSLILVFIGVVGLFFVLLGVRELLGEKKRDVCAICFAFSLTWIFLLVLFWFGLFEDKTIIALLMGMSLLGIFYFFERGVKKRVLIFRLPLLLTLVLVGYGLIEGFCYGFGVLLFLASLWGVFVFMYVFNNIKRVNLFVKKIVECCKKW